MHKLMKSQVLVLLSVPLAALLMGQGGCPLSLQPPNSVLVNQRVTVAADGGGGTGVTFDGTAGQTIRITLTAATSSMEPFGDLQNPDGTADYIPPVDTASYGTNTATVTLPQTGGYILTLFDRSNAGGAITVVVEIVSG